MLQKVISGGQSGVDRAALDAARFCLIPANGWCPKGRRAEDGPIPLHYRLRETPAYAYIQRTYWNVRDADATLLLHLGNISGGSADTLEACRVLNKSFISIHLAYASEGHLTGVVRQIRHHSWRCLNIAGPRAENSPDVYREARAFLIRLFRYPGLLEPGG